MENIKKQIYTLPEIRHTLKPLWSAWILTAVGVVCGIFYFLFTTLSQGLSSLLMGMMIVGGLGLVTVICFYLFGDSRRPYSKEVREALEPTLAYYAPNVESQVIAALEARDEERLAAVKRTAQPQLALVRYSDKAETVFYSQLLCVVDEKHMEPLTDIIVNKLNQKA